MSLLQVYCVGFISVFVYALLSKNTLVNSIKRGLIWLIYPLILVGVLLIFLLGLILGVLALVVTGLIITVETIIS